MVCGGLRKVDPGFKSSCQTRTLGDLGEMHPTEMFLLPEDTFWSLEKCRRLVHPAQASSPTRGGTESPEVQRPLAGHPPGPKGNTGPRLQSCGSRGAAAGSETRSRVRHQPQVPREQAHEVEDDGGFVAPRRVLEPGKETSGAEAGISSRETPLGPSPPEPPLQPSRPEPRLPARSTSHAPRWRLPPFRTRSTHSSPRFGSPSGWPEGLPPGAWPHQLELEGRQEVNERGGGPSLPPTPPATLPDADQTPDLGTLRTRIVSGRFGAQPARSRILRPRGGTERAEPPRGLEGPNPEILTQAATSRPAAASSSRVGGTPGNSSGLGRLFSTAWASARPRATRRSRAHDCGDPAELERVAPGPAPPCPRPTPQPPGRGPHRGPRGIPPWAEGAVARPPAQRLFLLPDKGWGEAGPPRWGR